MIEYNFTEAPNVLCAMMLSLSCHALSAVAVGPVNAQVEVAVSQDNDQDNFWLFSIGPYVSVINDKPE